MRGFVSQLVIAGSVVALCAALPVAAMKVHTPTVVVDGQRVTDTAAALSTASDDFGQKHYEQVFDITDKYCAFASQPGQPHFGVIACSSPSNIDKLGWDLYRYDPPVDGQLNTVQRISVGVRLPAGTTLTDGKLVGRVGSGSQAVTLARPADRYLDEGILLFILGAIGLPTAIASGRSARLRQSAAATAQQQAAAWQEGWDQVLAVAWAPPVVPPRPTLRSEPSPPVAAAAASAPLELVAAPPAPPVPPAAAAAGMPSAGAVGDEEGEVAEPVVPAWSGPAVLVLGPVETVGWERPPDRRVLVELAAFLVCHQERPVGVSDIRLALWPEGSRRGEEVKPETVGQHMSRLRRCLGGEHLPEGRGGYQLASSVSSDWFRFQALVEAARHAEAERAAEIRREALALVRGRPFAGVPDGTFLWVWDEMLVSTMEGAIATTAHRAAEFYLRAGRHRLAEWSARRGLVAVPTDEQLLADLMAGAAGTAGAPALARAWRDVRAVLGDQADTGPLAEVYHQLSERLQPVA